MQESTSTDVFVIGGGPAGLAAAIAARQQGLRAIVADGAQPPIDKPCGEGLMPDGVAALAGLGIEAPHTESLHFRGVRFLGADTAAEASFSRGAGLAIRRTALHRIMSERAAEEGVEFLWQSAVTGISRQAVHLGDRSIRTKWIVGADGANSRVRHWAGISIRSRSNLRYAFRRHYRVRPWTDHMEIYWGRRSQGYATAVSNDEVCVAVASPNPKLRLEEALLELPALNDRLRGAEIVSSQRGAITANRRLKRVYRENVALIGDASGTVDAITGQGLGLAFRQAVVLARCLKTGNLEPYRVAHRQLALRPWLMAELMLNLDGRPRLQRRTIQVFRRHPEIFRKLLALHTGERSPLHLAWDGLTFGWGLLTT